MTDPNNSLDFICTYPDRVKALEESRASRNPEPQNKVLSRQDTAKYLGVSLSTVDRLIAKEEIPFYKVGSRTLFLQIELDTFLLDKKKLPEGWEDEQFRQKLIRKEEQLRLFEINKRMGELSAIMDRIYKSLGDEGLKDENNAEQKKIFDAAFEELMSLYKESEEVKEQQIARLKSKSGIQMDSEDEK